VYARYRLVAPLTCKSIDTNGAAWHLLCQDIYLGNADIAHGVDVDVDVVRVAVVEALGLFQQRSTDPETVLRSKVQRKMRNWHTL
jgi:hypothetical protein